VTEEDVEIIAAGEAGTGGAGGGRVPAAE
jgi:hypothetical protein